MAPAQGHQNPSPITVSSQSIDELNGKKEQLPQRSDLEEQKGQSAMPTILIDASEEFQVVRRDKSDISAFKSNQDEPDKSQPVSITGSPERRMRVFDNNDGSSLDQI